jgi:hypothetical protein
MFHFHRDPNWEVRGLYAYYDCNCGAKRTRKYVINLDGPSEAGYPPLRDKRNRSVLDSGWVKNV